ncbi:MAG: hypothetical protein V4760_17025 [Bdellovibrionota bacterium]
MEPFYWYAGGVVVLFIVIMIGIVAYSMRLPPGKSRGDNAGLVTIAALTGPFVALWFIALGWVVAIFWRKFGIQDASLSQMTFYGSIAVLVFVIKSPFDAYKNFFRSK